jgi:hypothetical protein
LMKLWSPKEQHLRKHVRTPEITCTPNQKEASATAGGYENPDYRPGASGILVIVFALNKTKCGEG